jgi:cytochrome c oxidase subunit 2
VRGRYDTGSGADMDALARDAGALAGGASTVPSGIPGAGSIDGAQLSGQLGCAECHANAQLAPPLGGFRGRAVHVQGGADLAANEDYLRESIVAPAARLVAGYSPTIPSYRGVLTNAQVDALVRYPETPRAERDGAVSSFVSRPSLARG